MRSAIFHDFFGQRRAESTHIGEQVGRSGVEIHAHGIHTTLDSLIQRAFECAGIDVVLILSHADGLGIDFHQFGQGVGESASDGNGSANGDIVVGKFLTRRGRCRIDRGPVLAHEISTPSTCKARTNSSVSRPAVPLPMATASTA